MKDLEIENATVLLGGREILHDLSFSVEKGERCFILGANGAGKTTLVKTILGYAWPKFGAKVLVFGKRFGQVNLVELRKQIAWISPCMQQWTDPEHTALEMVISGLDNTLGLFRKPAAEEIEKALSIMRLLKCEHLKEQKLYTVSSGEQVKILICRALLTNPDLVILDEPSVYLDIAGREFLLDTIDQMAKDKPDTTIIFITQRIEDILPVFDRGMILKQGRIVVSGARETVLTEENLSRAFDLPIKLAPGRNGRLWSII